MKIEITKTWYTTTIVEVTVTEALSLDHLAKMADRHNTDPCEATWDSTTITDCEKDAVLAEW